MKSIRHGNCSITVKKHYCSENRYVWEYYICTIKNSDDCYYMVFSVGDLTEDEAIRKCIRKQLYENENVVKITVNNIYNFIEYHKDTIDEFNENRVVEIREG